MMCCFVAVNAAAKHKYTLVIDAGHGGKDAGACANGGMEKKINLDVALSFGRYVENNCPDVKVVYTRKTDVFIPLHERAAIANRCKADVFISIHTNSVASKKPVYGMETYTMGMRRSNEKLSVAQRENEVILIEKDYKQHYSGYDPRSPESTLIFEVINEKNMLESVELAQLIQKNTCAVAKRPNNGVKQDAFLVLRETSMPACLIELGYITTLKEKNYLTNPKNVDLMGRGIYQAFVAFKNKQHGKTKASSTPAIQEETVKTEPAQVQEKSQESVSEPSTNKRKSSRNAKTVRVRNAMNSHSAEIEEKKVETVAESVKQEMPDTVATVEPVVPEKTAVQEKPTVQEKPVVQETPVGEVRPSVAQEKKVAPASSVIFKVQVFAASVRVKDGDPRLKGLKGVDSYQEGGLWKHTIGASSDYNEIMRLRNSVAEKFPQAFIIAFRDGVKVDAKKAYEEMKQKK
ncbi:MAG: N-acetylmuramoyl-L-alanine amidase [Prevotella sp.]|nr:N-acetylmuramoyl-L-alanine amidase [Prevotella sp.]